MAVEADARRIGVGVREGEAHCGVVECGRLPGTGVVARLARLRETSGDVIRICRGLKIPQVAGNAGYASEVVIVVDVAIETDAGRIGMGIGQGESGS